MSDFLSIMAAILGLLKTPMEVYGFTFSVWDMIMVSLVAGVVIRLIVGIIDQ